MRENKTCSKPPIRYDIINRIGFPNVAHENTVVSVLAAL
jgi:hypothetical protein